MERLTTETLLGNKETVTREGMKRRETQRKRKEKGGCREDAGVADAHKHTRGHKS